MLSAARPRMTASMLHVGCSGRHSLGLDMSTGIAGKSHPRFGQAKGRLIGPSFWWVALLIFVFGFLLSSIQPLKIGEVIAAIV